MTEVNYADSKQFLTTKSIVILAFIGGTIGIVLSTIVAYMVMGPNPPERDGAIWPLFAIAWATPGFGFGSGFGILGGWAYDKICNTE